MNHDQLQIRRVDVADPAMSLGLKKAADRRTHVLGGRIDRPSSECVDKKLKVDLFDQTLSRPHDPESANTCSEHMQEIARRKHHT